MNRGFERSNGINDYTSASNSASAAAQLQGGAVLDGIREGVQGVSRLISAGLGELSSNTPYPSVPPSPVLGSSSSKTGAARRGHSTQPSSSSASTYATNASGSTRLSQSSASSLGEETVLPEGGEGGDDKVDWEGESKPIVKETGATPTLSHEPVFVPKPKHGLSELSIDLGNNSVLSSSPADTRATKLHRRKSKDAAPSAFTSDPFELSTTSGVGDSTGVKQTLKVKRASMSELSPASSKSGLGSLAVGGGQPVSSWVGSVGKKWEEIQRGPTYVYIPLISPSNLLSSSLFYNMQIYNRPKTSIIAPLGHDPIHSISIIIPTIRIVQSHSRIQPLQPPTAILVFIEFWINHTTPIVIVCVIAG